MNHKFQTWFLNLSHPYASVFVLMWGSGFLALNSILEAITGRYNGS